MFGGQTRPKVSTELNCIGRVDDFCGIVFRIIRLYICVIFQQNLSFIRLLRIFCCDQVAFILNLLN